MLRGVYDALGKIAAAGLVSDPAAVPEAVRRVLAAQDFLCQVVAARVAPREPRLPTARLAGPDGEIRLVLPCCEDLAAERTVSVGSVAFKRAAKWARVIMTAALELPLRSASPSGSA